VNSFGLNAAVDAVAAAVLQLRARGPGGDDEDDEGEAGVVKIELGPGQLHSLFGEYPLTPVYREFLRAHSSHDFVDAGLRCGARAAWISAAHSVRELTALNQDSVGWAPHWLVCAVDQDGCYVVDLDAPRDGDCPVLYVPGGAGKVETVAPSFVVFLRQVARDSLAPPVSEDRSRRAPPAGRVGEERQAAGVEADDRAGYVIPMLIGLLAAALLWWLR
jgi:hypothetical protein